MKNIAVITGASSGIGKEFVLQQDGIYDEIWGIALDQEGLENVARQIKTPFVCMAMDLTKSESFELLNKKLQAEKPNVKRLINCSGFGKFGACFEIDPKVSANMVDLNCKALLLLTEYVLPYMTKGSSIVQISSVAGFQPIPYIATYGATKAFVLSYSRAIRRELKPRKISVTTVCPFWTKTAFFNRALKTEAKQEVVSKYVAMYDPKKVVAKAIKDANRGKEISIYGFKAKSQVSLVSVLPKKWVMSIWINQQKLNKKYKNK